MLARSITLIPCINAIYDRVLKLRAANFQTESIRAANFQSEIDQSNQDSIGKSWMLKRHLVPPSPS